MEAVFSYVVGIQVLAILPILLMRKDTAGHADEAPATEVARASLGSDKALWLFVVAMVLFHVANAPQGIYFGLYMMRDLQLSEGFVAITFVLDMVAWLLVVLPVGRLADRYGCRWLLVVCWVLLAIKTLMIALGTSVWVIAVAKVIDGLSNGMFAVLAATWTVDRLGGRTRAGEAHAIVGTSLVFGSALGPFLASFVVESVSYSTLYLGLAAIAAVGTLFVLGVPNSRIRPEAPVTDAPDADLPAEA